MVKRLIKSETIAIRISPTLKRSLQELAERDHRSLSGLIVGILAKYATKSVLGRLSEDRR